MRISAYIATSLDGFIAREDGSLDWLPGSDGASDPAANQEDYGYQAFMDSVDTLVMGRNTFETVRSFGEWPYGDKPVVVLSRTLTTAPAALAEHVRVSALEPVELAQELRRAGVQHVYVDGGKTIQAFLAAGLLDALIVTRIPILIGRGIPLFGPVPADIPLQHVATRTFAGSIVQSTYRFPGNS